MNLKTLVGSGDKIGLSTLPVIVVGIFLMYRYPDIFILKELPFIFQIISMIVLVIGLINWIWCIKLILTYIPKQQLITKGPYHLAKHPLYTGVALLVLPWLGFLLHSWLGLIIGLVIYGNSRLFASEEEKMLSKKFKNEWQNYKNQIVFPWL